jgi:hypothetical protein
MLNLVLSILDILGAIVCGYCAYKAYKDPNTYPTWYMFMAGFFCLFNIFAAML